MQTPSRLLLALVFCLDFLPTLFFPSSGLQNLHSSPWCWLCLPPIHHAHLRLSYLTLATLAPHRLESLSFDNICFCTGVCHLPANADFDRLIVHSVIAVHLLRLAEWHAAGRVGKIKPAMLHFKMRFEEESAPAVSLRWRSFPSNHWQL